MPALSVVFFAFSGPLGASTSTVTSAFDAASLTAQESLASIRTLLALNGEKKVATKYSEQLRTAEAAGISKSFYSAWMIGCSAGVMFCIYAVGLWFGAFLIANAQVTLSLLP